jgi:hypothetical protein
MNLSSPRKLLGYPISLAVLDFGLFTVHANGQNYWYTWVLNRNKCR